MTFHEFIAEEGKREGKDPSEIMGDIYEDIAEDDRRAEQEMEEDPSELLRQLYVDAEAIYEPGMVIPLAVKSVKAKVSSGLMSSGWKADFEALFSDGKFYKGTATYSYYAQTRMEPADENFEITWLEAPPGWE
jgi:hypothetical protein